MLYGADLPGTRAFWSYQERKLVALEQWVQHYSDGLEGFNIFLTFTLPDLHLADLHRILPGSEAYLDKIVVQSVADIPPGAEASNYITKRQDYQLRQAAVQSNGHIVTEYAQIRIQELMEAVLGPAYGLRDYCVRTEFGAHGRCPHFHLVGMVETDMRPEDFMEACRGLFYVEDSGLTGEALEAAKQRAVKAGRGIVEPGGQLPPDIAQARQRVGHAAVNSMGIVNLHPHPHQHHDAGAVDILKTPFSLDANMDQDLARLVDKIQIHSCSSKCLRQDLNSGRMVCNAGYPKSLAGYRVNNETQVLERQDDYQQGYEFVAGDNNSNNSSANSSGPITLELLRNHPRVVSYNPELLLIWRGRCLKTIDIL